MCACEREKGVSFTCTLLFGIKWSTEVFSSGSFLRATFHTTRARQCLLPGDHPLRFSTIIAWLVSFFKKAHGRLDRTRSSAVPPLCGSDPEERAVKQDARSIAGGTQSSSLQCLFFFLSGIRSMSIHSAVLADLVHRHRDR